jgi:aminoglycoside phosphotransferase (APT) family kinase protein
LGRAAIEDIELDYIRYKPGMNCIARYTLGLGDATVSAYAKAHGPDAQCKMAKAAHRQASETALGPGRVLLEQQRIVFSVFPNDDKLKAMRGLRVDADKERLLERIFGRDSRWQEGEFDLPLNYKPERRYVVRLKRPGADFALLKFHTRQGYQRAMANQRGANVIGHSGRRAVIAHRWLAGDTLRDIATAGGLENRHITAAADALAALHSSGAGNAVVVDRQPQLIAIQSLGAQIGFLLPELRERAVRASGKLAAWLSAQERRQLRVHGDFYDKQVVIHQNGADLIDMDESRLDDPLVDLGNFIAHMERQVVSGGLSSGECQQRSQRLMSAYQSRMGSVAQCRLRHFVALGMLRLLHQPFRDFEDDWPEKIQQILRRVEKLIAGEEII